MEKINKYPHISDQLREKLNKQKIDIDHILDAYTSGMSMDKIQELAGLSEERLNSLLQICVTNEIKSERLNSLNRRYETIYRGTLSPEVEQIESIPLKDAIALVEGKDEEGEER